METIAYATAWSLVGICVLGYVAAIIVPLLCKNGKAEK